MARIIEFPTFGAYSRLPVTATNAEIIAFPRKMRADLPSDAVRQMARLLRERQIDELMCRVLPLATL